MASPPPTSVATRPPPARRCREMPPRYLPYISTLFPLYLPCISASPQPGAARCHPDALPRHLGAISYLRLARGRSHRLRLRRAVRRACTLRVRVVGAARRDGQLVRPALPPLRQPARPHPGRHATARPSTLRPALPPLPLHLPSALRPSVPRYIPALIPAGTLPAGQPSAVTLHARAVLADGSRLNARLGLGLRLGLGMGLGLGSA